MNSRIMSRWHGTNGRATKMGDEGELLLLLLLQKRRFVVEAGIIANCPGKFLV